MKCQVIPAAVGENLAEIQIRYWWNWKTKNLSIFRRHILYMHGNEMSLGHRGEPYCIALLARCRDWGKAVCLERRWFQRIVRTLSSGDAERFGDSFNCLYWRCVHQELHCMIWSFLPTRLHLLSCAMLHNCRGLPIPTHLY